MAPRKTAKKTAATNGSAVAAPAQPNPELIAALHDLERDRGLSFAVLIDALEAALVSAYKRNFAREAEAHGNPVVIVDREDGSYRVFARRAVVEEVTDPLIEISPAEAGDKYKIGDNFDIEVTPKEFGRIAAQTAKQVILQKVREAERDTIYNEYHNRVGELVTVIVKRAEGPDLIVDMGRTEARLPKREQSKLETYNIGERLRVVIKMVDRAAKGPQVIVSRADAGLVQRLFEMEVPEIYDGTVQIRHAAREAGERTKVAVASRTFCPFFPIAKESCESSTITSSFRFSGSVIWTRVTLAGLKAFWANATVSSL